VSLRCCSRCIFGFGIKREVNDEFVEPDDRALALPILLEEDDSQSGKSTEFLMDVLYVSVDDPGGLIDAGRFGPTNRLDEFEDARYKTN
jgi:hypothetical protein